MTFQRKLFLGFCLMVVPVILIGAEALRANREERAALRALGEGMKRTRTYAELETAMFNESEAVWRFLSGMDPRAEADFDLIERVVAYWEARWVAELKPAELGLAGDVRSLHSQIVSISRRVFALDRAGQREAAYRLAERELKARLLPALTEKNREIYRLLRENSVQNAYARLEDVLAEERRLLFSFLALSFGLGLLASLLISRGLARPLRELKAAMTVIGQGRLEHPIPAVRSRDEIGDLAREFARMTESLARSRSQLVQSEKLASIGEMSAAVAHGLRNPLASLRAAAQLALHQMKETPSAGEHLRAIIDEVDRLDRRITHLLSFSRPAPFLPVEEEVPRLVAGVLPAFAARMEEHGVSLEADLPEDLPVVRVDPMQLEQALVEILSNALDAMPSGGRLAVRAYGDGAGGRDGASAAVSSSGRGEVVLEVTDTGSGIPEQVLPSVCEPFFTTRAEGTGLGLAIARRYVAQNGGRLEITSAPGHGTTARIHLPRSSPSGVGAA